MYMVSRLLQHYHHFPSCDALLLVRHSVPHGFEPSSTPTFLYAKRFNLIRMQMATLEELGNYPDQGGDVVIDGGFGRDCGSGFTNHAEADLVEGEGIILGFGGPK